MMRNFFRVAALILIGATGVYLYELGGGTIVPAEAPKRVVAVAVSKSPPPRLKSTRTIDHSRPMPARTSELDRMIAARGGSSFPVLVPSWFVKTQAERKDYDVKLRLTDDGYTSILNAGGFEIVITGTQSAFRTQESLKAEKQATLSATNADLQDLAPIRGDYIAAFEEFDDGRGGAVAFGRYGVDYLVEFYCLEKRPKENCVDVEKAMLFLALMDEKKAAEKEKVRLRFGVRIGGSSTGTRPQGQPNSGSGSSDKGRTGQ